MEVSLSSGEVHVIKIWAESNIHGGHWGDGDFTVPEEGIILQNLDTMKKNVLSISEKEAQIILGWSESTMGIHTLEEESVIRKMSSILNM